MSTIARWDDPLARYAQSFLAAAEQLFKLLRAIVPQQGTTNNISGNTVDGAVSPSSSSSSSAISASKVEMVALRLEQQILTGHRLRKIVERYTKTARGMGLQEVLVGDIAWSAVAGQIKAGLGGYLQQLRLDIVCAASLLLAHRPQTAEQLVNDTATALHTMSCDVYRMINHVATPLLEKAEQSIKMATDVSALAQKVSAVAASPASSLQQQAAVFSSRGSNHSHGSSAVTDVTRYTGATTTFTAGNQQHQVHLVTLSANCQEYLDALRETADPVIAALAVCTRGTERLHRVHLHILRGLLATTVLGLVRRHSLLVSAVKSIRDISHKYHRIVEGQKGLGVILQSVLVAMGADDKTPLPAGLLVEVDAVGRLLQETMATCNVVREICGLLKQWIVPADQLAHSPMRHAFDHPSAQKTAVATSHMKSNGAYLLLTLRNLSALLRRVASAAEKTVTAWSEPALGAFSRILDIHSAPLLQCARVMANAQTDLKNLMPLLKEKAQQVEEARDIEDTLALLTSVAESASSSSQQQAALIYTSFENKIRECENLARTLFGMAARSTTVLQDVVATTCRPIVPLSGTGSNQQLPCQYIQSEISLLTQSREQLCQQHDGIVANLRATASTTSASATGVGGGKKNPANTSSSASISLQEITSISAARMTEAEQRAIAASCSFEQLHSMLQEADIQCDKWFAANASSRDPIAVALRNSSSASPPGDASNNDKKSKSSNMNIISSSRGHQLDDDQLATVVPEALLPSIVRNEDRLYTMDVVRGTLKHLESGQQTVLSVPRPDTVDSPAALNSFEDEFSVAFVSVEGLCEQVFSGSSTLGQIGFSMPSASSLDVLAKIGVAVSPASAHHHAGLFGGGGGGGDQNQTGGRRGGRSPSESSAGGATTFEESNATRSLYQPQQQHLQQQQYGGGASAPSDRVQLSPQQQQQLAQIYHQRNRGQSYVTSNLQATHALRSAMSSPAVLALGIGVGGGRGRAGTAAEGIVPASAAAGGGASPLSTPISRQTSNNMENVAAPGQHHHHSSQPLPSHFHSQPHAGMAASPISPALRGFRSFTSRAADAMPLHEMVPPQ